MLGVLKVTCKTFFKSHLDVIEFILIPTDYSVFLSLNILGQYRFLQEVGNAMKSPCQGRKEMCINTKFSCPSRKFDHLKPFLKPWVKNI